MPFLQNQAHALPFKVRRSPRVKRLQMIHRQAFFEVIAPLRKRNRDILQFVWEQRRWMVKQVQRYYQQAQQVDPFVWPTTFTAGETLPYRGERLPLNIKYGYQAGTQKRLQGVQLLLPWQEKIVALEESAKAQVLQWYYQEAMVYVKKTLDYYCPQLGRWPVSVKLKKQKTRWGSCGKNGKIYINWILVLAPPGVLEYVVVHELCHLFHRNHGKRFWAKVASCMPDYQHYDTWLAKYGAALMPQLL